MNLIRRIRRSISERNLPSSSRKKLERSYSKVSITQEETEQTENGDIVFMAPIHETIITRPSPRLSFGSVTASDTSSEDLFTDQPVRREKRPSAVSFAAIEEFSATTTKLPPRRRASYTQPPRPAIKAKPRYSSTSIQLQETQSRLLWSHNIGDKYNNIMGEFDDIVIGGAGWD